MGFIIAMKHEFSKLVLAAVIILYLITAVTGIVIAVFYPETAGSLYAFVGAPTATAIGFYSWKAKAENVVKLSKAQIEKLKSINTGSETGDEENEIG